MSAEGFGFPDQYRLGTPAEYKKVFANPVKSTDRYFTVLAVSNCLAHSRLGLAIAKKTIKKAVARNRIKRAARESFRLQRQHIVGIDIVVLARGDAASAASPILRKSLERHWLKLVERCDSCS
ncbi:MULTISPECIES: ribonuclease P protein component [Methylomonas]|uniref:Ribonuclease P protein component n=1 Tax=Methylomonas koyamae TaxID=702114 RepID=A0A177PBL6_9GAMM|nr:MULTISPECIES: ribonuclease P protein component [Methylomonas]ANE56782.1 ribonuclease P protein component [Methylomonas sp. DH-1]OAI19359.1 ribonuclease P protein component [Methylomonas koyamae]OAI27727.1 ribonuclease P protein component [Methylomonas koyamae]WNB75164.1 ribonuclease P protein component [Methylomonas koyamae]